MNTAAGFEAVCDDDDYNDDDSTLFISIGPVVLEGTGQLSSPWLSDADQLLLERLASQN